MDEELNLKNSGLKKYLDNLEENTIVNYLKHRKQFSPELFNQYIELKKISTYRLTPIEELKLFIKPEISYTYK